MSFKTDNLKSCKACLRLLPRSEFYVLRTMHDGYLNFCKSCEREKSRRYKRLNKEKCTAYRIKWRAEHRERDRAAIKRSRLKHREKYRPWMRNYIRAWQKKRRNSDINFKLRGNLGNRIWRAINNKAATTLKKSTILLIGCSIEDLKRHLESLFRPGMSWETYGKAGWEIDHVKPCKLFDLTNSEDQKKCFHYTNLQPLWRNENRSKGSKYEL